MGDGVSDLLWKLWGVPGCLLLWGAVGKVSLEFLQALGPLAV